MEENERVKQMHKMYALRVAIACLLGAMPVAQRQKAKAAMGAHVLAIEECDPEQFPGAAEMIRVMCDEFDSLERASALMPTAILQGRKGADPIKTTKPRKKKSA